MILTIDTTRRDKNGGHIEAYARESEKTLFLTIAAAVEFARNCKAIGIISDYIIQA